MQHKYILIFVLVFVTKVCGWSQEKQDTTLSLDSLVTDSSTRALLVKTALEYIGVSYRRGQSNAKGFDCSGYVKFVYNKFNLDLPHSSSSQFKQCHRITKEVAQPGDLVFFVTRGKRISHVGIYLGNQQFVHAPSYGKKVSVSTLESAYYKRRLAGFGAVL